jgi:DNA-binding NarL/FixJ family response regulator
MNNSRKKTLPMHTLLLCADVQFLGTTRAVLNQLRVNPKIAGSCDEALAMIQTLEFELILVDWREIENLAEFLGAVRRSKLNQECVLVAIVRDLLDLRQAFAAGVHFLIHKPASVVQIERCLRAAYCATVVRRRKQHREPVNVLAAVRTRTQPFAEATILNLSEGGVGLRISPDDEIAGVQLSAAEEVELRFRLPDTGDLIHATGTVVWTTVSQCGIRFSYIPESERLLLEQWITECVERSLTELCDRIRMACA